MVASPDPPDEPDGPDAAERRAARGIHDHAPDRPATALAELRPVERARIWLHWIGPGRAIATAGAVAVVAALGWWLLRTPTPPTEARLSSAATATVAASTGASPPTTPAPATTAPARLVVHVAGAVATPGVYELPAGSRAADAIAAAGGASPGADPDALNLAAVLADGDRVAVPVEGEVPAAPVGPVAEQAGGAASGPVDVNTASAAALEQLPGVGPATAQAIVAHREAHGPFASVDDLEAVRGIGPAKLEALRDAVTV